MKKILLLAVIIFSNVYISFAQEKNIFLKELEKFHFKAYGVVNYYAFDWDTDPERRNAFDTERINMYLKYDFTDKIQLKAEFEFEHGGTGVTMELDRFEEAGEFETEVEAGGEVKLEQLNILFKYKPWLNFRVGRLKLYMGNASKLDLPTDYFTGQRSSMENALLPIGWYENGIEVLGDLGKNKTFSYKAFLVSGLNSSYFSSANWIKRGHQKRFETINADGLAVSGRFDYNLHNGGYIGLSGYHGDANKNRHEGELQNTNGAVSIGDFHFNIVEKNWKLKGMLLYGNLQNSDKISQANRNLPNALNANGNKTAEEFTSRELEYLVSACENLKNKTAKLSDAWKSTGDNYAALLITANGSKYPSEKAVLETLVGALIVIADEVANAKIEKPFNGANGGGVDPTEEESRFSHNSKIDFANNVRSISNVYNGTYLAHNGKGLSEIVASKNSDLDNQFKAEILAAIKAIEDIPGTFTDAIQNNRSAVETAQVKVRKVQETLESEIKPLISNL